MADTCGIPLGPRRLTGSSPDGPAAEDHEQIYARAMACIDEISEGWARQVQAVAGGAARTPDPDGATGAPASDVPHAEVRIPVPRAA